MKFRVNKWWSENFWFPLVIGILLLFAALLFNAPWNSSKQLYGEQYQDSTKNQLYRFISYVRYIDLRDRIPVNKDSVLVAPISPIRLSRFVVIEKLSKDLKTIKLPMGTTGYSYEIRCPTHKCQLARSKESDIVHAGRNFRHWTADVDVSAERVKEPFTVIIESTVWNGFPNDSLEWYALHAEHGETTTMGIIFSKNKPPKRFRQMFNEGKHELSPYYGETRLTSSSDSLVWFWQVYKPDRRYTYELQWDW